MDNTENQMDKSFFFKKMVHVTTKKHDLFRQFVFKSHYLIIKRYIQKRHMDCTQ